MLKPTHRDVTMHTTVEITSDETSICLEVTYYFIKAASNISIIVQIEQLDKQRSRLELFHLPKNSEIHWAKKRIETKLLKAGKYKISISIVPHAAFIGDIRFCKKSEHYLMTFKLSQESIINIYLIQASLYVSPVYNYLSECKFLDGNKSASFMSSDNEVFSKKQK
jgi:hypothetical protein